MTQPHGSAEEQLWQEWEAQIAREEAEAEQWRSACGSPDSRRFAFFLRERGMSLTDTALIMSCVHARRVLPSEITLWELHAAPVPLDAAENRP